MGATPRLTLIVLFIQAYALWPKRTVVFGTAVTSGWTYPMCFMNISGGGEFTDSGFVQIYAFSINYTNIRVAALTVNVDEFQIVGKSTIFNYTKDYYVQNFVTSNDVSGNEETGIIPSSSEHAFFIGVKSDKGSTDAFLSLPLMTTSKEFYLAAWPIQPPFDASCMVIPALDKTCVELYKYFIDGSAFMLASTSLNQYDTFRYFANLTVESDGSRTSNSHEDMTGYYINATKPVQVLCAHECAKVPNDVFFCDHMVEQIPPVDQLGKSYVVPPIGGRSDSAGYVVRVVATKNLTRVTWNSTTLGINTDVILLGQFREIVTTRTMEALIVECSDPCVVMQYNKGSRAATNDVPTDPFMMLTVPSDHFTDEAGFATANYCDDDKLRIDFNNWVTIVTFASDKDKIRFNNTVLSAVTTNQWDSSVPGYAIVTFKVSHGFHYVSLSGQGSFACYVYGHSVMTNSASAYGFSANYKMIGETVSDVWIDSQGAFDDYLDDIRNVTCATEERFLGWNVLNYSYVPFPFILTTSFSPVSMSPACFQFYNNSFWTQLNNLTREINYWICTTQNCSFLSGEGVAINYATLAGQFLQDSQGRYIGLSVTVEVVASEDTSFVGFSTCRVQIRDFMEDFVNWPSGSISLFPKPDLSNCPGPLTFTNTSFAVNYDICPSSV